MKQHSHCYYTQTLIYSHSYTIRCYTHTLLYAYAAILIRCYTDGSHNAPEQGHPFPVVLHTKLPWDGDAFSWTHWTQDKGASLRVVDTGKGSGDLAAIATTLKTNAYSVIRISQLKSLSRTEAATRTVT
jgi:hypothetical protein